MKQILHSQANHQEIAGILLVNKPKGKTSFSLVAALRKQLGVKKIGHAGTLDPFATGLMVMLIGKSYTRLSDQFLGQDKEYIGQLRLGITTDSYDCDGKIITVSEKIPSLDEVEAVLARFQGEVEQIPPMFSAKKIKGKKLYELARQGIVVERQSVKVNIQTELINYTYPFIHIRVKCSKGTYIRSIAHEVGLLLGCGAHLSELERTKSGSFHLQKSIDGALLYTPQTDKSSWLSQLLYSNN